MSDSTKRHDEIIRLLEDARLKAPYTLIHEIANSMASFIAEIDRSSIDVSAYIEQRLQPLAPLMLTNFEAKERMEEIARDGRKLKRQ